MDDGCGASGGGRKGGGVKLVKRGKCTFETKSVVQRGYEGLVIVNSEDNRFIMSEADDTRHLEERMEDNLPLTVMVSSKDGEMLLERKKLGEDAEIR